MVSGFSWSRDPRAAEPCAYYRTLHAARKRISSTRHKFDLQVLEAFLFLERFLKRRDRVGTVGKHPILILEKNRATGSRSNVIKKIRDGQVEWINQIMASNAPQTGKNVPRKIKITLFKAGFLVVIGMTGKRAETVFENELECGTRGFGCMTNGGG